MKNTINEILSDCQHEGLPQDEAIRVLTDALEIMNQQLVNKSKELQRALLINAMKYKQLRKEFVKLLTSKINAGGTEINLNIQDEEVAKEITKSIQENTLSKNYKILLEKYSKLEQENIKLRRKFYAKNKLNKRKDV